MFESPRHNATIRLKDGTTMTVILFAGEVGQTVKIFGTDIKGTIVSIDDNKAQITIKRK